tara:strand:- start:65 stop:268 length:204 start_codon:yes stop_codon:yes gene_type:complete
MSDFWNIFKSTAYVRVSLHIQDIFIDGYNNLKYNAEKVQELKSLRENSRKINNALYDNPFNRKRKKK